MRSRRDADQEKCHSDITFCDTEYFNSGDDIDNDIDVSHEPPPTRRDVLKAVTTIGKYNDDMNDPIACKMEVILGAFTRQLCLNETRTMKNS